MTERTELVPAAPVAGAGSASSAPPGAASSPPGAASSPLGDLLRALACAAIVATCVASPESALVLAPFVPALVAIRLLRRPLADPSPTVERAGRLATSRRFVVSASVASTVAAVLASTDDAFVPAAIVAAALLVPILGVVHARAARRDPVDRIDDPAWPEPRVRTGLTATLAAWSLATCLVVGFIAAVPDAPTAASLGEEGVDRVYGTYDEACADGGALAELDDTCQRLDEQQATAERFVADHAPELLAALAAVFAFGCAATAHAVVLSRARRASDRIRPAWRLEQLELHWAWSYVAGIGIVGWLLADLASGESAVVLRALSIGIATLGVLAIAAQGVGFLTWSTARSPRKVLIRVLVVLALLAAMPIMLALLLAFGMLDLALHPRRRTVPAD